MTGTHSSPFLSQPPPSQVSFLPPHSGAGTAYDQMSTSAVLPCEERNPTIHPPPASEPVVQDSSGDSPRLRAKLPALRLREVILKGPKLRAGTPNYSNAEVTALLDSVVEVKPLASNTRPLSLTDFPNGLKKMIVIPEIKNL